MLIHSAYYIIIFRMKKKIAIVTGGARGIGAAIAQRIAGENYHVVICSRSQQEIDDFIKTMSRLKLQLSGLVTDISKFGQCQRLFNFIQGLNGELEILVNNAGIYGPIGKLEENSYLEWEDTIRINLLGTVYCTQLAIPIMQKRKSGKIINICGGGVGGKDPLARFSAYYTSKTAIAGFTEVTAAELAEYNIQVNCIAPGAVNSRFTVYLISQGRNKAGDEMYTKAIKQKKTGGDSPELAARLVSFLISNKANHISGCLLSAKWDKKGELSDSRTFTPNLYKLRRSDNRNFWDHE